MECGEDQEREAQQKRDGEGAAAWSLRKPSAFRLLSLLFFTLWNAVLGGAIGLGLWMIREHLADSAPLGIPDVLLILWVFWVLSFSLEIAHGVPARGFNVRVLFTSTGGAYFLGLTVAATFVLSLFFSSAAFAYVFLVASVMFVRHSSRNEVKNESSVTLSEPSRSHRRA